MVTEAARSRRWPRGLAVLAILMVATAVRLVPLTNGLPYEGYVDEGHVFVHRREKMLRDNTTDPGWYQTIRRSR